MRHLPPFSLLLPLLAASVGSAVGAEELFVDTAVASGLDFVHVNGMSGGFYFSEMMGSGGALLDYDNDGDLDVYLVQGGPLEPTEPSDGNPVTAPVDRLYRNDLEIRPDGRRTARFVDVTPASGIRSDGYGMGVATGEQCQNRVVFKQLMQAGAIRFCQIDACRLGGVNEVLAVLLMAAKFGVPVCPHAGGVGLCEYVQHLAIFDYLYVSASLENRIVEYVDHLHEHFLDPVVIRDGRYTVPTAPGYSIAMKAATLREYAYTGSPTTLKT